MMSVIAGMDPRTPRHVRTRKGSPMSCEPSLDRDTVERSPAAAEALLRGMALALATPIVRVSLGSYPPEREHEVAAFLDFTNRSIGDDLQRLPGLVWYYSGIDRARHAIVNVSLWRDVPSAEQMSKLQAMLDLGAEMSRMGVQFVRPIPNFEPVWTFTGVSP